MDQNFFSNDDLKDLLSQLEEENSKVEDIQDPEMEASERRYKEIIEKNKSKKP